MDESFFRGRSTASDADADGSWTGRSPGDVIGDFRLISPLGRGGMGQVWEAEQTSMGRKVALKLLHTHVQLSDDGVQRFEREAKAGGKLAHPGIVQIHSVGEADGVHFMAQELIGGSYTLADSLADFRAETELPPGYYRKVAELFAEMAEALAHAHKNGVVHRDIKPSNILIGPDEKPKVADFGLAMVEDQLGLSRTGDFMGTPFYMSPEQAASKRMGIDHRTDIFSLGATLYEALTLTRPFTGDTSQQVFHQILVVDPPDPKQLRSRVPQDLAVICLKALEKDRERRYSTMAEFGSDLRRHLADEPILAKPPSTLQRTVKWVRRNPTKWFGTLCLACIAVVGLFAVRQLLVARDSIEALYLGNERLAIETGRARNAEAEARLLLQETEEGRKRVMRLVDLQSLEKLIRSAQAFALERSKLVGGRSAGASSRAWIKAAEDQLSREGQHREDLVFLLGFTVRAPNSPLELGPRQLVEEHFDFLGDLLDESLGLFWVSRFDQNKDFLSLNEFGMSPNPGEEASLVATVTSEAGIPEYYADHREFLWHLKQLYRLVETLQELKPEGGGLLPEVRARLEFEETIQQRSIGDHQEAWDQAIASISDPEQCPQYDGLEIGYQLGLVPLGRDSESGMWEFCHLQTGSIPERGEDGRLMISEETGLVFVLLPGGTFLMGAQSEDPAGDNYDPFAALSQGPVHSVELDPFLLSKYEMTQAQWTGFTGENPAYQQYTRSTETNSPLMRPVEHVSQETCREILRRMGLVLPTEAQWEFSARGGTSTVWWTGNDPESLAGAANVADRSLTARQHSLEALDMPEFEDGFPYSAPVGTYRPNPYGLHEVIGNVGEWCDDYPVSYTEKHGEGDGFLGTRRARSEVDRKDGGERPLFGSYRGGSFESNAREGRSANRSNPRATHRSWMLGVRPARALDDE